MRQCPAARRVSPSGYVGFRCLAQRGEIEHLLAAGRGVRRLRLGCRDCVLAELMQAGHVASAPVVDEEGRIRFLVTYNAAVRRVLERRGSQVLEVRRVPLSAVLLTPRQREVLAALRDEAPASTRLAKRLGVSRAAAASAARRLLRKLAMLHA